MSIRDWGEAFAVAYALDDARTHLLPAAGAELLRWVAAAPQGVDRGAIVAAWAAETGADAADDAGDGALLAQRVDELIERLMAAGLLRTAGSRAATGP